MKSPALLIPPRSYTDRHLHHAITSIDSTNTNIGSVDACSSSTAQAYVHIVPLRSVLAPNNAVRADQVIEIRSPVASCTGQTIAEQQSFRVAIAVESYAGGVAVAG